MSKRMSAIVLCLALLISMVPIMIPGGAAIAATQSLHIVKYASDGTTVLAETTIDYATMELTLPVQGDGTTHYYMQGPTFDPANLWDSAETLNLKDKGALKGTDLKDLCELVGGMSATDTVNIKADDGYNENFDYQNVYTPMAAQGPMGICWYKDGNYVPAFEDGLQLVFFAQTTNAAGQYVFGHQDMHDCLPEANWHYYYSGGIEYPSANGLSIKYINEISIYTSAPPTWSLELVGASTYNMSKTEFENGVACHGAATWVDTSGNTWSGMPLWLLVGWVDDNETHGPGAFNDALAATPYNIDVIASDAYTKTFSSADIANSSGYIVANQMNGAPLAESYYPLRLVGSSITSGGNRVGKIARIELHLPAPPPTTTSSLQAIANVVLPMIGIALDRDSIDYGDVGPGESSAVEKVGIVNIGTVMVNTTLEVQGDDATAQEFYELSLYIDYVLYNSTTVIATIPTTSSEDVDTQLNVPSTWNRGGSQEAAFIFWAEAA